jgi:hypothetical protein
MKAIGNEGNYTWFVGTHKLMLCRHRSGMHSWPCCAGEFSVPIDQDEVDAILNAAEACLTDCKNPRMIEPVTISTWMH